MKISSYATSILAFGLLVGGGSSIGLSGCAASSKSTDLFGDDGGSDDGGVVHSDSGKHDGGTITPGDGGTTGNDSGTASGDCAAFCAKEATVTGCPSESACNTTCQSNSANVPAACQASFSAVLQCAVSPGMIASCSGSQAKISGCDSQITALTSCLQGAADGGTTTGDAGSGTKNCGQLITCLNACAANDQNCVNTCFNSATPTAQADLNALQDCLFGTNGTSGACGSVCGSQTTACTNCLNAAQASGGACYTQLQTCAANM